MKTEYYPLVCKIICLSPNSIGITLSCFITNLNVIFFKKNCLATNHVSRPRSLMYQNLRVFAASAAAVKSETGLRFVFIFFLSFIKISRGFSRSYAACDKTKKEKKIRKRISVFKLLNTHQATTIFKGGGKRKKKYIYIYIHLCASMLNKYLVEKG